MIRANSNWQLRIERLLVVFFYRMLARWVGGYQFLLLTTTGRKSGRKRTVLLVYMPVEDRYVVTAANLGSDLHPGWYLNLRHNPQAQIQIGGVKITVLAEEAVSEEREKLWTQWLQANPGYQGFQDKTARKLPMVILSASSRSSG